jgi:hypothetical protein
VRRRVLCRALAAQLAAHGQAALGAGAPALSAAQWGASVAGVVGEGAALGVRAAYRALAMKAHHDQLLHTQVSIAQLLCELPAATVAQHLAALFAQAGALLIAGGHCGAPAGGGGAPVALLDDTSGLHTVAFTARGQSRTAPCWTHARVRHQLDVFLVLFRAARVVALAVPPPRGLPLHELHEFHKEAGMDRFNHAQCVLDAAATCDMLDDAFAPVGFGTTPCADCVAAEAMCVDAPGGARCACAVRPESYAACPADEVGQDACAAADRSRGQILSLWSPFCLGFAILLGFARQLH